MNGSRNRLVDRVCILCGAALIIGFVVTLLETSCANMIALELPQGVARFASDVLQCWAGGEPTAGATVGLRPLYRAMLADSFLVIPAYAVALSMLSVLALPVGASIWRKQVVCVLPVVTALFDFLENGLITRAAESATYGALGDQVMPELGLASICKWSLLAVASLQLGGLVGVRLFGPMMPAGAARNYLGMAALLLVASASLVALGLIRAQAFFPYAMLALLGALVLIGVEYPVLGDRLVHEQAERTDHLGA